MREIFFLTKLNFLIPPMFLLTTVSLLRWADLTPPGARAEPTEREA